MSLLEFDAADSCPVSGRTPFLVRHRLAGHELFPFPGWSSSRRLSGLARRYTRGDVPLSVDPARTPAGPACRHTNDPAHRECKSWLVLKNVGRTGIWRSSWMAASPGGPGLSETLAPG